jgi:hypothetical protein
MPRPTIFGHLVQMRHLPTTWLQHYSPVLSSFDFGLRHACNEIERFGETRLQLNCGWLTLAFPRRSCWPGTLQGLPFAVGRIGR